MSSSRGAHDEPGHLGRHQSSERRGRRPIGPSTERSLIDRARDGDLDAFELIVRSRMDAVYRLSLAITGEEADARDAAQETFLRAWRSIGRLRDTDRFDAWLQRIAVNQARMVVRTRRRRRVREIPASRLSHQPETAAPESDAARLGAALELLTTDQRAILALHHLEGRSVEELGKILGIPVGTVKSRLFTARKALDARLRADADR
ncbi:MAG TPA: sigma-70 family RNA polymerase sigma factor [Vitreimonas sp.]|nr:sigma-70 family RNA polymerase sigma factor [Vitreimonas sp.]